MDYGIRFQLLHGLGQPSAKTTRQRARRIRFEGIQDLTQAVNTFFQVVSAWLHGQA